MEINRTVPCGVETAFGVLAKELVMRRKAIGAAAEDLGAKGFINRFSIGHRLTLCFVGIFVLLLAENGILLWQVHSAHVRADRRLTGVSLELIAVLNLQSSLQSFNDRLDRVAQSQDAVLLRQESGSLRDMILDSVQDARNAITHLPPEVRPHPTFVPTILAIESTLPSQLESLNSLAASGDWSALRLRLANEKQPLDVETSMLVKSITRELNDELGQTVTNIARLERQIAIVLPLTALGALLIASLVGLIITRSITTPLGRLMEGSSALSRGVFDHLVPISGDDELARLGRVFNDTAGKLRSLYETLQDSKAKLEEAQRITHVGYWEWDLATDCLIWSDETYRIFGLRPQERPMNVDALREMIHPEDRDRVFREKEQTITSGVCYDVEHRIVRPSGEVRVLNSTHAVKKDESGRPTHFYGTVQDITDRKRAQEALQQNQFYLAEGQRLAHTGSWAFDATGFSYWSPGLFQVYGLDPRRKPPTVEEYLVLVHPEDRAFMKQGIAKMLDDHLAFDFTKRIVRPDGEIRHVRCVGVPVTQGGTFQGFLGTGMDVTDQERLTEELRRSESHLAEAQKLTHTGSWAWRLPDRKAVHLSKEWYRIYGFDPAQGAPTWEEYFERLHPEDRVKWKDTIERAIMEKADYDLEFRVLLPNGMVKWIHTVGHPFLSGAGDLEQFVGSSTDITELKSAEQEREKLRQLEADLAHTNRVSTLGEMAASLAHEIKQPIAAAITSANSCIEWLAHEPPNLDRARAAAARIDKYGNRAAEIIDRIRSFYKKSPPQRELVDVNGVIHEMLTLLKGEACRFSVAMRTDLSAELPKIMADRVQLQQVFMNLMLNAIEAMKDSGGELTVKSELQDGQLQFSVSDTGVGLPAEKMDQIFSAFFTTKPQGSGMGLAISRSIVESHGGQLWATANDGRGATFHFTLPTEVTEPTPLVFST